MTYRTRKAYAVWAATYDRDPNPNCTLEYESVLAALAPQAEELILDAGAGTGRYLRPLMEAGATVISLDFCAEMLSRLCEKYDHPLIVNADLTEPLPFRDAFFNRINCSQTLKHLVKLNVALSEFARVLKPNGLLVFSVTHPAMHWDHYEMRDQPTFILSEESDIFPYRLEDYTHALRTSGYKSYELTEVPVSDRIAHLLTPASLALVQGRKQIAIFTCRR